MKKVVLSLSGDQHEHLKSFLFPGDGAEAVAVLLCGERRGDRRHRLVVREIHGIPYDECRVRTPERVTWDPDYIAPILERAAEERLSVVKVHSHPGGYPKFSAVDDEGDHRLLPMIRGWVEADLIHGSAVMLPDGEMFGRYLTSDRQLNEMDCISVAGDDLQFWHRSVGDAPLMGFASSHAQAFDEGTINRLQRLSFAVIGASGTGSPTIEQLARLGASEILIVDDDCVEERNINRIINSTMVDVQAKRAKVDVLKAAVDRIGLGTNVIAIDGNLWEPDVIRQVAQCDVIFGCMDSIDGRYLLNTLATFYTIPYFDIGIRLDAVRNLDGTGRIREVCGTVNYIRPGRSSLMSRDLFTMQQVAEAGLGRNDRTAHATQIKDGYISGVQGRRPAVISVNMLASALAVDEFLARLHPFREESNASYAAVTFSLSSMEFISEQEAGICPTLAGRVGCGDMTPLLGMPELSDGVSR